MLVFGHFGFPRMGATGIAIGTLMGLSTSLLLYLIYFSKQSDVKIRLTFSKNHSDMVLKSFAILFTQDFFEYSMFYFLLLGVISKSGVIDAATYGVLTTIFSILIMYAYSYGNAIIILARKEFGNIELLSNLLKTCVLSFFVVYLIYTYLIYYFDYTIPSLITIYSDVYENSAKYILLFSVSQFFIGISTMFRYYLNGMCLERYVLKTCCIICSTSGFLIYLIDYFYTLKFMQILMLFMLTYILLSVVFYLKIHTIHRNNKVSLSRTKVS